MQVPSSNDQLLDSEVGEGMHKADETSCQNDESVKEDSADMLVVVNPEEGPITSTTPSSSSSTSSPPSSSEPPHRFISHFANSKAHPKSLRYGIPFLLIITLGLLLASDIGSGVVADYYLYESDGTLFSSEQLVHVSIFTTVRKLWSTQSYALAIFITCTSVSWPFVKLFLSLFAWVTPYNIARRREMLLEIIDVLGKWSFVDIMVFVEILVAFRSRVELPEGNYLDVFIVPRWGFFGFVFSTMLSLLATQLVLHRHRLVSYRIGGECSPSCSAEKQRLSQTSRTPTLLVVLALILTSTLHLVGCFLSIYRITNQRGSVHQENSYSVVTVGQAVPNSTTQSVHFGITWIQYMWFFLVMAMPLWSNVMLATLYLLPMSRAICERVFLLFEIAFSWSAAEVLLVSTTFAILQIPAFGNGLVKVGCKGCYVVGSKMLGNFAVLVVGTLCQVAVSVWLYRRAHRTLYCKTTSS